MTGPAEGLAVVRGRLLRAARDAGRDASDVTLIAVSKTVSGELIRPVLEAGQRQFGENYVQETAGKWPELRRTYPDVTLHLIGPLQSNKAREAVELFDVIQTVDRPSLAAAIAKAAAKVGRTPRLLCQVNTGEEPQKGGVSPAEVGGFLRACRSEHGLTIDGLMCIPPAADPPSPHFALLARLAGENGLSILSMGMSADFPEAVQLGATHVRVGSSIFGARPGQGP